MISFKSFVNAIHDAIMGATDSLMDKNEGLLDKYFEKSTKSDGTVEVDKNGDVIYKPKMVVLEYLTPSIDDAHKEEGFRTDEVHVPLITLVPLQMSQVEKAVLTANFEMELVDDELQLKFNNGSRTFGKKKTSYGKLEITISPVESSEGLKNVVEGYENMLKRQIS